MKSEASRDEVRVLSPTFLPDGRRFLYLARLRSGEGVLMLGEAGKPPRRLMSVDSNVQYVEPGLLVFARGGTLVGQRFDAAAGQVAGEQFSIAASVRSFLTTGVATFTASRSGSIVYQSSRNRDHLAWLDRSGRELEVVGSAGDYLSLRIAPSGHTALFSRTLPATGTYDVWSLDLDRGGDTRLTTDDRDTEIAPLLLPGGGAMIFSKAVGRAPDLVRKDLGTGQEEVLLPGHGFRTAEDVSPDGRWLAYSDRPDRATLDLWMLPLSGPRTPSALQHSHFNESGLRFSPDGRYYLFLSDQSGRTEVYVSPVSGGVTTPASVGGAQIARWSPDSREILYLSIDRRVVSVPVRTTPALELGTPSTLFVLTGRPWRDFDVSADGKRFLAIVPEVVATEQPLTAILNWSATVRR